MYLSPDPLQGLFETTINGKTTVVGYVPDTDLRDTEQIPLLEEGGIEAFLKRVVLPHATDAWYVESSIKIGYEISFTRYFYKPQPMRSLEEIRADILALGQETEGLLGEIFGDELSREDAKARRAPYFLRVGLQSVSFLLNGRSVARARMASCWSRR